MPSNGVAQFSLRVRTALQRCTVVQGCVHPQWGGAKADNGEDRGELWWVERSGRGKGEGMARREEKGRVLIIF